MTAALVLAALVTAAQLPADSFPHGVHRRLFTSCVTCHVGIQTGDTATARPSPEFCQQCHDGEVQRRINWSPSPPRGTNLRYDHVAHAARVAAEGDEALACVRCHATGDSTFMDAGAARPESCLTCHAHRASNHYVNARCAQCHRPLPEATRLAAADVARFPKPTTHDSGFVLEHGPTATSAACATCHARDFCAACHVNAALVPAIQALGSDARLAGLLRGRRVSYPEPPSHEGGGFIREHGALARQSGGTSCANCHTRGSCLTCHREEERVAVVAQLPERRRGGAPGVELSGLRPPDHTPDFTQHHRVVAAAGDASCSRCHAATFCASCHDAAAAPGFHGTDFVQRHSQAAFASETECAACHQTEAFCRDCHVRTGRTPTGAGTGRYHDAQPLWTFSHGAVARRAIETCASCHQQVFCLQCHSASSGWRVNPHGRDFDPGMERKNPALCRTCHTGGAPRP